MGNDRGNMSLLILRLIDGEEVLCEINTGRECGKENIGDIDGFFADKMNDPIYIIDPMRIFTQVDLQHKNPTQFNLFLWNMHSRETTFPIPRRHIITHSTPNDLIARAYTELMARIEQERESQAKTPPSLEQQIKRFCPTTKNDIILN